MPHFKKIVGTYPAVVDQLGLPAKFYGSQSKKDYATQVKKDLGNRTPAIISFHSTAAAIVKRLAASVEQGGILSFTQGNFNAGVLPMTYLAMEKMPEAINRLAPADPSKGLWDSIQTVYVDQDDVLCGMTIAYLRQDPINGEPDVPMDLRERPFIISIIKNTTAAPKDRQVTYLSHEKLLDKQHAEHVPNLDEAALQAEIVQAINEPNVSQLIAKVINNGKVSLDEFNALKGRLREGIFNIDQRDEKALLPQIIADLEPITHRLNSSNELNVYLEQLKAQLGSDDLDFYRATELHSRFNEALIDIQRLTLKTIEEQLHVINEFGFPQFPQNEPLYQRGQELLTLLKALKLSDSTSLDREAWSLLQASAKGTLEVLNQPTQQNIEALAWLSHQVSGKASPVWQVIGGVLMGLAIAAAVALCVLAALPSAGLSLGGLSLGIAFFTPAVLALGGSAILQDASEKGLARAISRFSLFSLSQLEQQAVEVAPIEPMPALSA